MSLAELSNRDGSRRVRALRNLALLGGALFLIGLFVEPRRAWGGFLMGFTFLVGLSLAGPLFLSIANLAGARWATPLRAVPAAMATSLPFAFVLGLVLLFGVHSLYEWSHDTVVEQDHLLAQKSAYLNSFGFALRLVVYFAIWWWMSRKLCRPDPLAEEDPARARTLRQSVLFMALFAVTFSLASVDWLMSLEPHWFSTMYALRTATGLVSSGLAAATLLVLMMRNRAPFRDQITRAHLEDLGRLTLSFSILWVYIWYCEYMLIWYSNIPEETSYYVARGSPGWSTLTMANLGINWLVPFAVLLLRSARGSARVLWRVSILLLVGRAFDLYMLVGPSVYGDNPVVGAWEIGAIGGMVALFFAVTLSALPRSAPRSLPEAVSHGAGGVSAAS